MNRMIQLKQTTPVFLVALLLCFWVLQGVQAVVPAPDGGYPGGNTAEGQNALLSLTSGGFNTAVGFISLRSNTTGQLNTAIGAGALLANTADQNTATGAGALLSNTSGTQNAANGAFALFGNTEGAFNTANGVQALFSNTTGNRNTASGNGALFTNTTGSFNTASGVGALFSNTGGENTATGHQALFSNTSGQDNTAVGTGALQNNHTGSFNIALGAGAGGNSTGNFNIALGASAANAVFTASNVITIGSFGADVSSSCFIGNIRGVTTANADAISVVIDSAGQLGTMSSSARFKKEIKAMDKASESLLALKPVTFHYKSDTKDTPQFGLIAEEVAKVNPDLVVRDDKGEIYTVRYDAVNAMLLNEFLKEHTKVQKQQATVADLKLRVARQEKQIAALASGLQRVSAQIEMGKPAPQMVTNNH